MANQTVVRHINERRLLAALRIYGSLPRAELARRLSLTRAAVTSMVDDLMGRGLVREEGASSPPARRRDVGRPGVNIGLHPAGAFFLGVEIGVGIVRFALIDLAARPVETFIERISASPEPEVIVRLVARRLAILRERPDIGERIHGLCVTVPGLVRTDGYVINLPILGWKQVNLARHLAEAIDLPSRVENNANAAAFGYVYSHPRSGQSVMVYLKIGTGCGGAVLIEDRLLRGSTGLGAELGHLRVADDGPLCVCGQRGCLETFVNLKALQRYANAEDVAAGYTEPDLPRHIADRLKAEDETARAAVDTLARYLSRGLTAITNLFNPAEIILGGPMLPLLGDILERTAASVARSIVPGMPVPAFTISQIGEFECAIGAAALVHHSEFDLSNLDLRV